MDSVVLSAVPYTGFDYGQPLNTLFWVGLALWSLWVAGVIMRHRSALSEGLLSFGRALVPFNLDHAPEPRVMQERVLVPPTQKTVPEHVGIPLTPASAETRAKIDALVNEELAESRVGMMPDEFTEDDFATVDFDGVNPDDMWEPESVVTSRLTTAPAPEVPVQTRNDPPHVAVAPVLQASSEPQQVCFTDSLCMEVENGIPRLVLKREGVTKSDAHQSPPQDAQ